MAAGRRSTRVWLRADRRQHFRRCCGRRLLTLHSSGSRGTHTPLPACCCRAEALVPAARRALATAQGETQRWPKRARCHRIRNRFSSAFCLPELRLGTGWPPGTHGTRCHSRSR